MIQIPLLTIISGLLTIGVRLTGLMLFAPFFGSVAIPSRVKAILVLSITVLLFPTVGHDLAASTLAHLASDGFHGVPDWRRHGNRN